MSATNAVESLLTRLRIEEVIPAFRAANVDRIVTLRALTEDKLKELVPEEETRKKLTEALSRHGSSAEGGQGPRMGPPAIAAGPPEQDRGGYRGRGGNFRGRGGFRGEGGDRGRGRGGRGRGEGDGDFRAERAHEPINGETYQEEISVPYESVRLLLGNKAEKLNKINTMCGTTNSRIERPEAYQATYSFWIRGTRDGVARARGEIERFVGITRAHNVEARFQYVNHELDRNVMSVKMLCAANTRAQGTPMELSQETLKKVVDTFRFQKPPEVKQYWSLSGPNDKEKFEIVSKFVKSLDAVQAIVFTEPNRVVEMSKRAQQTAGAFGVKNPQFVHRDLPKEERLKALEAFKIGEVNEKGLTQRLLVTNNDYAKLARKIAVPYVNLIVHFAMPKTKEFYTMQTLCAGRNGHAGLSVLFITHNDASAQKEWSDVLPLVELSEKSIETDAKGLVYDSPQKPLNPADADPPANWREALAKEKEDKAAAKKDKEATATK